MAKTALSEKEKIHILNLVNQHGHQQKYISEIVNRKPETVKAFYNSYTKFQTISPKRGRSVKITEEVKYNIVQTMKNNPLQNLQDVATEFDVAKSSVKSILNENKIQYFKRTPIFPLTFQHKLKRYQFFFFFQNFIFYIFRKIENIDLSPKLIFISISFSFEK